MRKDFQIEWFRVVPSLGQKVLDFALTWTGGAIDGQTPLWELAFSLGRRPFVCRFSRWDGRP